MANPEDYGLSLANIPIINLRAEFFRHRSLLHKPDTPARFRLSSGPIETPYFTWYGMPHELLTWLLVRAVMGIEAYLPFAVLSAAGEYGVLTTRIATGCHAPFSLSRRTADAYYNRLPALLHSGLALSVRDGRLWAWISGFYPAVRNPLFHGSQLDGPQISSMAAIFNRFAEVYQWIDSWYSPPRWMNIPGAS
jgi:hypothetical protein